MPHGLQVADEEYLTADLMMHPGVSEAKKVKILFSSVTDNASGITLQ